MKGYLWLDLIAASDLTGPVKGVGYALAHFARGQGVAWPSYDTLARAAGVHRVTAIKALATLEQRGLVTIQPRAKESGGHHSNLYVLTNPEGSVVALDNHPSSPPLPPTRSEWLPTTTQISNTKKNTGVEGLIRAQANRWAL